MNDLIAFLRARLDEDEVAEVHDMSTCQWANRAGVGNVGFTECDCRVHRRWAAGVQAKRAILEIHRDYYEGERATIKHLPAPICAECSYDTWVVPVPCPTVRMLGLPYTDHQEFREEWKP